MAGYRAGIVPQTAPPAYARRFGNELTQQSAARSQATGAALEANAASLGHILGNLDDIAAVGGGAIAPDKLLSMYANSQDKVFNNPYAQEADALRLAKTRSEIAKNNRVGRGGGAKGPKPLTGGQWYEVKFADGTTEQRYIPFNETDAVPYHLQLQGTEGIDTVVPIPTPEGVNPGPGTIQTRPPGADPAPTPAPEQQPQPTGNPETTQQFQDPIVQDLNNAGIQTRYNSNGDLEVLDGDQWVLF